MMKGRNETGRLLSSMLVAGLTILLGFTQLPAPLHAQVLGSINGTVTDETGAVVPGARVVLTDIGTGQVREAATSGEGFFEFPYLPPHQYSLTTSLKGFEEFKYSSLILEVGQHMTVNPTLRLGSVTQTVQVNSTPPSPSRQARCRSKLTHGESRTCL